VAFLQYETTSEHATHRIDRFMAAWQLDKDPRDTKALTPYTMVDSGQAISNGERDYQREYRGMIDAELPRPPTALLYARRDMPSPSQLDVEVQVTNVSTSTLETVVNGAMLHLVVFDGTKALKTGNDIYATRQATFDAPLLPGDTRRFSFTFQALRGVNLARTGVLAMVDYQPAWEGGRHDMMQAAFAGSAALPVVATPQPTPTELPTDAPSPTVVPTRPASTPVPTAHVAPGRLFMPSASRHAAPWR
jgi:hypothetical protein